MAAPVPITGVDQGDGTVRITLDFASFTASDDDPDAPRSAEFDIFDPVNGELLLTAGVENNAWHALRNQQLEVDSRQTENRTYFTFSDGVAPISFDYASEQDTNILGRGRIVFFDENNDDIQGISPGFSTTPPSGTYELERRSGFVDGVYRFYIRTPPQRYLGDFFIDNVVFDIAAAPRETTAVEAYEPPGWAMAILAALTGLGLSHGSQRRAPPLSDASRVR